MIQAESASNPAAVPSAGAVGLMYLMSGAAVRFGLGRSLRNTSIRS
ncbi:MULTISPECIES: transglycosylase SLT domain-containing protein [Methylomicrobium]|nr:MULTISPECIES: transglycosylase SLT domain-containing protein [Methylomicrobium]